VAPDYGIGGPLRLPPNPLIGAGAVTVSQTFSFTLRVTPVINYLSAEPVDA